MRVIACIYADSVSTHQPPEGGWGYRVRDITPKPRFNTPAA